MEDLPANLSASQQEALTVLRHMLAKLKEPGSRYYSRYGKWVERHTNLDEFCFACVRPTVWTFLSKEKWNLDAMKNIGGQFNFESRGIYCDGIYGLDRKTRLYIGQSQNLRYRLSQHWNFRYRRDNPSLHYHALQQSSFNVYGLLAVLPSPSMGNHALPGMDCPDLLLNVLEMWMGLAFKCLQRQTMEQWALPGGEGFVEGAFGALNIASPLDNRETGGREWVDLSECEDPLVRDYIDGGERKRSKEVVYTRTPSTPEQLGPSSSPATLIALVGVAVTLGIVLWRTSPRGGAR